MTCERKIYNTLLGVALGDSMGMPVEFWTRSRIQKTYGRIEKLLPGNDENEISRGLPAGTVTDDTHQTLLIAKTIIENKGTLDPISIIRALMVWVRETGREAERFLGPSSKQAINDFAEGVPVEETGKRGSTNGGAMRIIPVGIISPSEDLEQLVYNVSRACLPTHNTDIAIAGAAGIAAAVSLALDCRSMEEMIEGTLQAMRLGYKYGRKVVGPSVVKRTELAFRIVERCESENSCLDELYDVVGTGLSPAESVPTTLALVKMAKGDPMHGAILAANIGGDCDTIGAMTTGICTAMKGLESVPKEFVTRLIKTNRLELEEISSELALYRTREQGEIKK